MPTPTQTPRPAIFAGQIWRMGHWDLDGNPVNGEEEIVWRVLAVEGNCALLITRDAIAERPYHSVTERVSWRSSALCSWLNSAFLSSAFSGEERAAIVTASPNPTGDALFLLDTKSAKEFFSGKEDRKANVYGESESIFWWLRTISDTHEGAYVVKADGTCEATRKVGAAGIYVRPAVWVRCDLLP